MKNNKIFERVWGLLGPILFPVRCPVCDEILSPEEVSKGIHLACEKNLYFVQENTCMHCGRPLVRESAEYCLECQRKKYVLTANLAGSAKNPYYKSNSNIFQGKALFVYGGKLKQMMYRFKYGNRRVYAEFFARKAFEKYGDWIKQKQIDVIVPVPMYQKKKKIRGYNQAEVFAEALARVLDIPVERNLVCRIRDTIPQKGLNDMERKNNLKNAFQIEKSIVQYRHILVVDDIYTTGSTAEAVAEELIKTGVSRVYMMNICIGKDM